jgi:hypothetical protein
MAIIYTISGQEFEIGSGFSYQGVAESPSIVNPFPKYSISREYISAGDDTHLGNRYNITVSGRLIVPSSADATVDGEKQNALHKQMIWHLQTLSSKSHNLGKLEIVPHGGLDKPFIFVDARLRNIEFPEQDDQSLGVLFSDYTFQFEAYLEASNNNESFCLKINSAEESWELSLNEDEVSFYTATDGTPYKTYTLTHTISANGIKSINSAATEITPAWKNAAEWVKTRVVNNLSLPVTSDVANNSDRIVASSYFYPTKFDSVVSTLCPDLSGTGYSHYNHIRTPTCNMSEGSYSVTETWFISNMPATLDMEIETSVEESGIITMTLSGTIKGLDGSSVNSNAVAKIANAEIVLSNLETKSYNILVPYYPVDGSGFTLQNVVRQKTIGRNKGTGIITFSYTYNDQEVFVPGAISSSLKINDNNLNKDVQTIAIIPIIGKVDGPIIQDMNTTPESSRSLEINVVMNRSNRVNKPNLSSVYNSYKLTDSYTRNFDENWEPYTGSYTLSIEWVKE